MSTRANYFRIGVFVIAMTVVLVAGIIVLTSGVFGPESLLLETYIDESVYGLNIGSPVMQRGVQIGRVQRITFVPQEYDMPYDTENFSVFSKYVMVIMAVDRESFAGATPEFAPEIVKRWVKDGLRLKLSYQGVTGMAYVEADYMDPEKNPVMQIAWKPKRLYIPAAPSTLTSLTQSVGTAFETLDNINLVGIAESLNETLALLNRAFKDADVPAMRTEALGLMADLRKMSKTVTGLVDKSQGDPDDPVPVNFVAVAQSLNDALKAAEKAIADARVAEVRTETLELVTQLKRTNEAVQKLMDDKAGAAGIPQTIARFNNTLKRMDQFVSDQQSEFEDILADIKKATGNLRELTEHAKRYPSQVIFGAPPPHSEVAE